MKRTGPSSEHRKIDRIWKTKGLKTSELQLKGRRFPDNNRLCGERHLKSTSRVWSCHFITAQTYDGLPVRILAVSDEYTQEFLCSFADRHISAQNVTNDLFSLFLNRGIPKYIRFGNDNEGMANAVCAWLHDLEIGIALLEPGKNRKNGCRAIFEEKLKRDLLGKEHFASIAEARAWVEDWRREYNRSINLFKVIAGDSGAFGL